MRIGVVAAAIVAALVGAAAADAHVTVDPRTVASGAESVQLDIRVPSESSTAATTKVAVKLPDGFAEVRYEPVPGWKVTVTHTVMTWTGHGPRGRILPGQFLDFPITVGIPDTPGKSLVFKAVQTYSDGTVTRWIGPPGSDNEAPVVRIAGPPAAAPSGSGSGGASNGLAIVALVIGTLGLLAGGVALLRRR